MLRCLVFLATVLLTQCDPACRLSIGDGPILQSTCDFTVSTLRFHEYVASVTAAPTFYYKDSSDRGTDAVTKLEDASDSGVAFISGMARDGYFDNAVTCPSPWTNQYFGFEDVGNSAANNWVIFHMREPLSLSGLSTLTSGHPSGSYHGTLTLYGSTSGGNYSSSWTQIAALSEDGVCARNSAVFFPTARYSDFMVTMSGNARTTYQHLAAIAFHGPRIVV